MVWQRDVDLVVPLWQGGDDVRVAAGAAALARLVPPDGSRLHVSVSDGPREMVEGVRNLEVLEATLRRLREHLARRDPARALTLGGDCLSDLPVAGHLAARHPGMAVYWLDAHADLNTAASSPSGLAHGMALRLLLGEGHPRLLGGGGVVAPWQVRLVGGRDLDVGEEEFARAVGLERVGTVELIADPGRVVAGRAAGSPAYVHLDVDLCDPVDFPAVACPVPQGPLVGTVAEALAAIASHHEVVGVGVCEYVPVIEHDAAGPRALLEALGLSPQA
ncbi:arginase family protein [Marinactinospora thermotolerans]|uniref:Arginase n=1 Tax=Marinactinospora thermotolerans DSM 45154 TaxID=1122192 RepID=A0A1T4PXF8_9ACTN|nr:arginase family protein [Marinactinospora thermotolerans]SJZ95638.1 arginase [Marinactinospora thermotolerans DSM 45154]